jgi:protein SCO1
MNKIARVINLILAASLAVSLVGCDRLGAGSDNGPPPLAGARMGGAFALMDQDGRAVTDQSYPGSYRLIYFGYTFCPDVCPVDVQVLGQGVADFEKADPARGAKVQPIFITVDPKRDTPTVVKAFVANFHPRMVGLTGTEAQIDVAAKNYAAVFERHAPNEQGAYLVDHSRTAILYDPKGAPIAIIPQDQGPKAVANELARWVR